MVAAASDVKDAHEHDTSSPWLEVHISLRLDGRWEARTGVGQKALCVTPTLREAVAIARVHARKQHADIVIQKADGQTYIEASYRKRPEPAYSGK